MMNINKAGQNVAKVGIIWCLMTMPVYSLTFAIRPGSDIVGAVQTATVQPGEDFSSIGKKFDVGYHEIMEANPDIDPDHPDVGTAIIIPTQYILPSGPRRGIVINLAELRLYYFHKDQNLVTTHPISIGRREWETPLGKGKITEKVKNPTWHPPASIRAWYEEHDKFLPEYIPPGPDNPLGKYALKLSIPGYLIHGTNNLTGGVGIRSSSGCIRMLPVDIESLFYKVSVGDPVRIIHKPYKIGRYGNRVYAETHKPLSGEYYEQQDQESMLEQAIEEAHLTGARFNPELAMEALERSHGYPILIE
jgi:L,D-transpeptidase ErfK/SrfK